MSARFFRINSKEYCHINDDTLFIINGKEITRIPLEHELDESWGVMSILNYLFFIFLFIYTGLSVSYYKLNFFLNPVNYGAIFLLFLSFKRMKEGFVTSKTPSIPRAKIKSVLFKSPTFSNPHLLIFFEGIQGKVLKRTIPVLYKQEALAVLKNEGLIVE